jgi:hypothetical protein
MDIRPPERSAPEPAGKKPRDRMLLRTAAWGVCAALAVATLLAVAQEPAASKRIERALSGADERPAARPIVAAAEPQRQRAITALEARIDELTKDRDRLARRVAALEHNLDDMTGSIVKSADRMKPSAAQPAAIVTASVAPAPPGPAVPSAPSLLPPAPILLDPLATPPAGAASILPPESSPRPDAKSEPEPAVTERVAALTPPEPPKRTASHPHPEFGVELATAPSMEALRQRWVSAKANFGPLLVGLSPVAVRDRHPGSTAVRLVAGPVPSITAARKLCARFADLKGDCWPARIDPADVVH